LIRGFERMGAPAVVEPEGLTAKPIDVPQDAVHENGSARPDQASSHAAPRMSELRKSSYEKTGTIGLAYDILRV